MVTATRTLDLLEALVACDTQNPPRSIDGDSDIFRICNEAVGEHFQVRTWDHGEGHVSWFARRGNPKVLFNVHLDTVPNGEGWSHDPLRLRVEDGLAFGRGACDIKGAAAILLQLAESRPENMALLFTTDEEGAGGCCVSKFIETGHCEPFEQVVVAEPTGCRAVLGHRGYLSVKTWFHGIPGHSSEPRALDDSAVHRMAVWARRAIERAREMKTADKDPGSCLNIGRVDAGTKSNVIAGEAFVHWSARLRPGESNREFLQLMQSLDPAPESTRWEVPFSGAPLPAAGQDDRSARAFCSSNQLDIAPPVDFWTEAALFSAGGIPAIVLGPGHIEQAHIANEWVSLEQLSRAQACYGQLVKNDA